MSRRDTLGYHINCFQRISVANEMDITLTKSQLDTLENRKELSLKACGDAYEPKKATNSLAQIVSNNTTKTKTWVTKRTAIYINHNEAWGRGDQVTRQGDFLY